MNKDTLKGEWKQVTGRVREKWGKLTDDDMAVIQGNYEQLVGFVQARYGQLKDQAKTEVDKWLADEPASTTTTTTRTTTTTTATR